ncbi:hypothetical protein H072_1187 [Dactylellina haptotyla CBS 200.50]|uniref:Jacalin-type lectin domain-containing protein n=1 Tax=Dactylellina haptotyla (strain CBS 200.50) TaxID=1284197 RepID=S8APS3_DACHA|nr:hypothetical protein H072_1187 [Dactylellina haptotyla CBS 200.50]
MASVDLFKGPVTALNLTRWLFRCEDTLADWEDDNNKTLTEKRKIKIVGRAISNEGQTQSLYDWYNNNLTAFEASNTTWDEFRDAVKQEALGKGWRLQLLRELYTSSQGSMTVKEYASHRDNLSFVISRIGHEIPKVVGFAEKAHLLFQADPGILDAVLDQEADHQRLVAAKKEDIVRWLTKHESAKTGPTSNPSNSTQPPSIPVGIDAAVYMHSGCYGSATGHRHSSLLALPQDKAPHVTHFSAIGSFPELRSFTFTFENPALNISPLGIATGGTSMNFSLGVGEHIRTFKLSRSAGFVDRISFVTSKGVEYTLGGSGSWDKVFEAPSGWGIVGLHSYSDFINPYFRVKALGCVFGHI